MQLGFDLFEGQEDPPQENAKAVMKELCVNCKNCRLTEIHPANRGMIYRGNINAKIAIVGIAPGPTETEKGTAMIGPSGKLMEQWMKHIGVDTKTEVFITNIIQCQPAMKVIDGKTKQRDPDKDEINACFGPRCLRVLRAMPNLEVIITLGWLPAKVLLGTKEETDVPKTKSHEGQWFESSLLPGKGIFCLSHPAELLHQESPDKSMSIQHYLDCFKREYLDSGKILPLIEVAKSTREGLNK